MMKLWDTAERAAAGLLGAPAARRAAAGLRPLFRAARLRSAGATRSSSISIVWAVMIASSQLVRTDGHVRPDLVLRLMPARGAALVEVFNCIVAIGVLRAAWFGTAAQIADTSLRRSMSTARPDSRFRCGSITPRCRPAAG